MYYQLLFQFFNYKNNYSVHIPVKCSVNQVNNNKNYWYVKTDEHIEDLFLQKL